MRECPARGGRPGQLAQDAVIGERGGASRLPAGAGTADRAAAPATGGLPVEGSGQAAAPGAGESPVTAWLWRSTVPLAIPMMTSASRKRAPAAGRTAGAPGGRALEDVLIFLTGWQADFDDHGSRYVQGMRCS